MNNHIQLCLLLTCLSTVVAHNNNQTYIRSSGVSDSDRDLSEQQPPFQFSTGYIVGGAETAGTDTPWFVHFGTGICGASLIAPNRVLTAAHCVSRGPPATVRVGATSQSSGEEIEVQCVSLHPNYNGNVANDLAVIKLKTNAQATPVELNADANNPSVIGQKLTVVGLGRVCTDCPVASTLLKVDLGYVSREECDRGYGSVGTVNAEQHLCAVTSSAGSCNGDSGGPMFDESYRQVGIVSFGSSKGCATGIPDGYTRVSTYIDWINEEIASEDCKGCDMFAIFRGCEQAMHFVVSFAKRLFGVDSV